MTALPAGLRSANALADAREADALGPTPLKRIMTTDTVAKAFSTASRWVTRRVTITGISKGAGMIRPSMATMLGFIATDANMSASPPDVSCWRRECGRRPRSTASPWTVTHPPTIRSSLIASNQLAQCAPD